MNKELQLYCIPAKKRPRYVEGTKHEIFPNHLSQYFDIGEKSTVWCTDFTYIKGWDGKFQYNCSILDLSNRIIVATKTGRTMTSGLAKETLETALSSQKERMEDMVFKEEMIMLPMISEVVTDEEWLEVAIDSEEIGYCLKNNIKQSMSKAGYPYDNAVMERFFGTMKFELINRFRFNNDKQLETAISEYVFGWYNQVRPHASNGYKTPNEIRNT